MPLTPEQQLWMKRVTKLREEERERDKLMLTGVQGRVHTDDGETVQKMLKTHLVESGRSRGEKETGAAPVDIQKAKELAEAKRAVREDTLVSEVTERIELSANAVNLSEEVVKIVETEAALLAALPMVAPVKAGPAYPLLALHAARPLQPLATNPVYAPGGKTHPAFIAANLVYNTWPQQNNAFNAAKKLFDADVKARSRLVTTAPVRAAATTRIADLKTQQPDQYQSMRSEAVKKAEAKTGVAFAGNLADQDALTDKHLMQVYVIDEIDKEISAAIAAHDASAALAGVEDAETRLDEIAKIIEVVGLKYDFTNLAHFISRHGAERVNPTTRDVKRTKSDAVARIATGVGPDQVPTVGPLTTVDGNVGGTAVKIPEYTHVGEQTASASSQHASAKAAMFMLEEGAAQVSREEHLANQGAGKTVNVVVGAGKIGADTFGSYPEAGGLGDAYQLKGAEDALGKKASPKEGELLPKVKIQALLDDMEQLANQQSALVVSTANTVLGGHTPMTMMSKNAMDAFTGIGKYVKDTEKGTEILQGDVQVQAVRVNAAKAAKISAEATLAKVQALAVAVKTQQTDTALAQTNAQAAVDVAIVKPVNPEHQIVIDDVTGKARDAATTRFAATASAAMAASTKLGETDAEAEVQRAQLALAAAKVEAGTPTKAGLAKTTEQAAKDALDVENIDAWTTRALGRQAKIKATLKTVDDAKAADEISASKKEALLDAALKTAGPVLPASLDKVAALAKAGVEAEAASANVARWAKAVRSAEEQVAQAEKAIQFASDENVVLAKELSDERAAKDKQADDLAKAGGTVARVNLAALEVAELKAIEDGESSVGTAGVALTESARLAREAAQKLADSTKKEADDLAVKVAKDAEAAVEAKRLRDEAISQAALDANQRQLALAQLDQQKESTAESAKQAIELKEKAAVALIALETQPGAPVAEQLRQARDAADEVAKRRLALEVEQPRALKLAEEAKTAAETASATKKEAEQTEAANAKQDSEALAEIESAQRGLGKLTGDVEILSKALGELQAELTPQRDAAEKAGELIAAHASKAEPTASDDEEKSKAQGLLASSSESIQELAARLAELSKNLEAVRAQAKTAETELGLLKESTGQAAKASAQVLAQLQASLKKDESSAKATAELATASSVAVKSAGELLATDALAAMSLGEKAGKAREEELAQARNGLVPLAEAADEATLEANKVASELQKGQDADKAQAEALAKLKATAATQDLADQTEATKANEALVGKRKEAVDAQALNLTDAGAKARADLERFKREFDAAEAALQLVEEALALAKTKPGEPAAQKDRDAKNEVFELAKKRLESAQKDATQVEKTLKAEGTERAAIEAKAIERARADVRLRIAKAVAGAPDATADEKKIATRAQARYDFADAETALAEVQIEMARAKSKLAKAGDARDKAVAATVGKVLNESQKKFLAEINRRADEAQLVVDGLEKAGGTLELAGKNVADKNLALDAAEKL